MTIYSRSVAGILNAARAGLLHTTTDAISSSKFGGQIMGIFQDEASSMNPERTIHCVLHQQDESPNLRYHHKNLGSPLSPYSCPRETQLVASLFRALLSQANTNALYALYTAEYISYLNLFSSRRTFIM